MSVIFLLVFALSACGGDGGRSQERAHLVEALTRLVPSGTLADRKASLDGLAGLKLVHAEFSAVRDLCLKVHQGLLSAEVEQASARRALDGLQGRDGGVSELDKLQVAAMIRASSDMLDQAQKAYPDCQTRMRELMDGSR